MPRLPYRKKLLGTIVWYLVSSWAIFSCPIEVAIYHRLGNCMSAEREHSNTEGRFAIGHQTRRHQTGDIKRGDIKHGDRGCCETSLSSTCNIHCTSVVDTTIHLLARQYVFCALLKHIATVLKFYANKII